MRSIRSVGRRRQQIDQVEILRAQGRDQVVPLLRRHVHDQGAVDAGRGGGGGEGLVSPSPRSG